MKKLGFGISVLVLIIASVIFYLDKVEQKQIKAINKLQEQVTSQLSLMQKNGFNITNREIQKGEEHFFITIIDPDKASVFLTQIGLRVTPNEVSELKDIKFNVDLLYLNDIYSLDIYPVEVPPYLKSDITNEHDKKILAQLEEMIKRKVFFIHLDIDHSATTFNGHMKDIEEKLQGENEIKLSLIGLHFSGKIKNEKIVSFKQFFDTIHLFTSDEVDISISDLQSSYVYLGPTIYDYSYEYNIGKIESSETGGGTLFVNNLTLSSISNVTNGLATEKLNAKVDNIDTEYEKEKISLKTLALDMNISNLDVEALEKLQRIDTNKEKEVDSLLETLISNNIHVNIPNFSVERVTLREEEMSGFTLYADLNIDKSLNIYSAGMKPKYVLKKVDGKIHLTLSKELLNMIKEDPKAMLTYMMYRPKRELGQRIYDIDIGGGEIKINGKAVDF